jgi:hypothetical protein
VNLGRLASNFIWAFRALCAAGVTQPDASEGSQ